MQNYIITDGNKNNVIPAGCMPGRADMAISFICHTDNGLLTYDYNPAWNSWYPFYDDVNKTPIQCDFNGKTFKDLIAEHERIMPVDLPAQLEKAHLRFAEIFGTNCKVRPLKNHSVVYELKYSKSQNIWTLYRIYNFVITEVAERQKMLNPVNMKYKFIKQDEIKNSSLITNTLEIYDDIKDDISDNVINMPVL